MKNSLVTTRLAPWSCLLALLSSCQSDFEPASRLTQVRILGMRSETPYVRPGAAFTAEVLAYDGRRDSSSPMRLHWLKDVCVAPENGEVEDCYRRFASTYEPNQDLTPLMTEGPQATFEMPVDAVETNPPGPTLPVALVFVAACAGHVEFVGSEPQYPASVPFACFDGGRRLGANDFVFAFMRLYISTDLDNENPAPSGVTLDGVSLPVDEPFSIPLCSSADLDDCPARNIAVTIGDDEQELDPTSGSGGERLKEQIWSSFFVSAGKLESESLVLFDGRHGRTSEAENEYRGPNVAGDVDLFVVTHDNRSGTAFQSFKLRAE